MRKRTDFRGGQWDMNRGIETRIEFVVGRDDEDRVRGKGRGRGEAGVGPKVEVRGEGLREYRENTIGRRNVMRKENG